METYDKWAPTGFDTRGLNADQILDYDYAGDWFVAPCARNRDSGLLDESNWAAQSKIISESDPDGHDHAIASFGHWACGWFEIVLVRPGSDAYDRAVEIENSLDGYPVLDGSDLSERENEAVSSYWERMSVKERLWYCQKAKVSIFAARREYLPEDPDGRLFEYLSEGL